jgi:DNA-binding transcriptional regulator YiaG
MTMNTKNQTEVEMTDFEVLIPSADGSEIAAKVTVKVPITRDPQTGEEILTPEAHDLIEITQARYMGLMLPEQLKALRKKLNLTQQQLGELLQVGEKSYTRWETGKARQSRSINVLLCGLRDGRLTIPYLQNLQKPVLDWWSSSPISPLVIGQVAHCANDYAELATAA